MVEVSLTVGKLDASLALLLTKDHHLIEFPTILLPNGVKAGSIVKIRCDQDFESEKQEAKQFQKIQDSILATFGTNVPKNPVLKIRNITQTSCVLEWEPLDLGTASLKNLFLVKNSKKLGAIPQPLTNRTTKLSGLPIDKTFEFQLRLDTTAGVYLSETIEVTTHKMTDLSGITVCLGDISINDPFTVQDIEDTLKNMGAKPLQKTIQVDTTHFICTRENSNNPEYLKACEMNIPVVRPEWLKTCERERRIVGVRDYYTKDCLLPDILAKNYWAKSGASSEPKVATVNEDPVESEIQNKSLPEVKIETPLEEVNINENENLPEVKSDLNDSGINGAKSNEFSEGTDNAEQIEHTSTEETERITKPQEENDNEIKEQISNGGEETHHTEVEQPIGENEARMETSVEEQTIARPMSGEDAPENQAPENQIPEELITEDQASKEQILNEQAVEEQVIEEQAAEEQAVEEQAAEEQAVDEQAAEEQAVDEQAVEAPNEETSKEEDISMNKESKEADENPDDGNEVDDDDEDNNDGDVTNATLEQDSSTTPNSLSGKKKKNKKKKKSKN